MDLRCIKHPHEPLSFDVCLKCLESIPSDERGKVIAEIREEYEIHNQLAEKCRTVTAALSW